MSITHAIPLNWRFSLVVLGFIAAVPLGWYLGSPLFVNRAVSEALPSSQASGNSTTGPHVMAQGAFGIVDLSANPAPRTSSQLHDAGAFEVAPLKGNIGTRITLCLLISTWITSHRWSSIVDGSMWSSAARS
jgi:hypothetical protein